MLLSPLGKHILSRVQLLTCIYRHWETLLFVKGETLQPVSEIVFDSKQYLNSSTTETNSTPALSTIIIIINHRLTTFAFPRWLSFENRWAFVQALSVVMLFISLHLSIWPDSRCLSIFSLLLHTERFISFGHDGAWASYSEVNLHYSSLMPL